MKTQIEVITVNVCGRRLAKIEFCADRDCWRITSPACEFSRLYPAAVDVVRWTLGAAYDFCKCLLVPVFDDNPDNPQFTESRLTIIATRFSVSNDDESKPFATLDVYYYPDSDKVSFSRVIVPDINVAEQFSTFEAAYSFCRNLSRPSMFDVFNSDRL